MLTVENSNTYNSVINKTAISARTNRQIGGRAPSKYLSAMEKKAGIGPDRMDEFLTSHRIEPGNLRDDRFWEFYGARAEALLRCIETATGKSITRDTALFCPGVEHDHYDEGPGEWGNDGPSENPES